MMIIGNFNLSDAIHVEQSLPICIILAALGGILEVGATAVTAVISVREKEGIIMKPWVQWLAVAGNVALQAIGTLLSHLFAAWFGPISLVVPFFYSATLLTNMLVFGFLGEKFTKNMKVGTYVILVAVILLPEVGPQIQHDQKIEILLRPWYSFVWFTLLNLACGMTGILLMFDITRYNLRIRTRILLIARATAISVNLTVSRAFILGPSRPILISFIVIKILSGAVYTYAIVVQSIAVEQARFVPLNATLIIIVNAVTGIIIWEDWKVIDAWYAYICIFVLLGLGCDLLLSVPLLNAENPHFAPKKVHASLRRKKRQFPQQQQQQIDPEERSLLTRSSTTATPRREAWKQLLSPMEASPNHHHHHPHQSPDYFQDNITTNDVWADKFHDYDRRSSIPTTAAARIDNGNNHDFVELGYRIESPLAIPSLPPITAGRVTPTLSCVTPISSCDGTVKEEEEIIPSRFEAWKETLSPLKLTEKTRYHNGST